LGDSYPGRKYGANQNQQWRALWERYIDVSHTIYGEAGFDLLYGANLFPKDNSRPVSHPPAFLGILWTCQSVMQQASKAKVVAHSIGSKILPIPVF
jgi:hypothetical protein